MNNFTPAVKLLLLLNVAVFFLQDRFIPVEQFALFNFLSPNFRVWQLLTHMFMHNGGWHLFGNMLSLFFFGAALENRWGTQRFLIFYLVCGLGASLMYSGVRSYEIHQIAAAAERYADQPTALGLARFTESYGQNYDFSPAVQALRNNPHDQSLIKATVQAVAQLVEAIRDSPMLGASGAVFGILFAFGYLYPNTEIYLYLALPIKAKYFVSLYGLYELYQGFQRVPGDNVAHFAHLGGMLFAFILLKYWERTRADFY